MKLLKKAVALLLCATMTLAPSMYSLAFTAPTSDDPVVVDSLKDGYSDDANAYEIYPVPHSVNYGTGAFTVTDEINVVAEDEIDTYTLNFLEEVLNKYGRTMIRSEAIVADKTNILLGIKGSGEVVDANTGNPVKYPDLFTDTGKYDPYLLKAEDGTITILGKDTDCVFYGVATLQMMFSSFAGKKFLPVEIEDYSNVLFRGFIEGFYGSFTYAGRESQMRSSRDVKGNMYVFASKTDPYHGGEYWDDLYPEDELNKIEHLVKVGKETKVEYTWSIHVGRAKFFDGINDANRENPIYKDRLAKLIAKFEQLYGIGVRNFHVLCDDMYSGPNTNFDRVVMLLNDLNAWRKEKGDCGPIVYCCDGYNISYANNNGLKEMEAIKKALDKDVYLYWTGDVTNSPITQENINFPLEKSEHYPVTWLNYPCNEHCSSGMFLGNIDHYVSTVDGLQNQMGIISNPYTFAEANKIAYFQLLSWGWNRDNYMSYSQDLWEDSFKYLQPEVYEAYLTLARNISNSPGSARVKYFPESEYIKDALESVQKKITSGVKIGNDAEVAALQAEFKNILESIEEFRAKCTNETLVNELNPWLNSLKGIVTGAKNAVEGAIALETGELETAKNVVKKADAGLDEWDNYKAIGSKNQNAIAKAGSLRIQPFTTKVLNYVHEKLAVTESKDNLALGKLVVVSGDEPEAGGTAQGSVDGNINTYWSAWPQMKERGDTNTANQIKDVEWITVDLNTGADGTKIGGINTIESVTLKGRTGTNKAWPTKYAIMVSDDGDTFQTVKECEWEPENRGGVVQMNMLDAAVQGRYIKIQVHEMNINASGARSISIAELEVNGKKEFGGEPEITENLALKRPVYASGREVENDTFPAYAVDEEANTHWSSNAMKPNGTFHGEQTPSWIVIDLGENVEKISAIRADFFKKVWPSDYVIQVASEFNGGDFTDKNIIPSIGVAELHPDTLIGDNALNAPIWTTVKTFKGQSLPDHGFNEVSEFDTPIPAGTRYIRLYFNKLNSVAGGDAIGLKEITVKGTRVQEPPHTHTWKAPVWTWNGYEASVRFVCEEDESHVETPEITVTSEITTPATCIEEGEKTYTATVTFEGKDYTDTTVEVLPMKPHHLEDGICVDCGKDFNNDSTEHKHAGDGTWVSDTKEHWHVCECGDIIDKEAHTVGNNGECTVCHKVLGTANAGNGNSQSPNTGDTMNVFPFVVLLVAAFTASVVVSRRKRTI